MIRFIYIGSQIHEDHQDFAFWDTVTDSLLFAAEGPVFESVTEFLRCVNMSNQEQVNRCLVLIPDWYLLRSGFIK